MNSELSAKHMAGGIFIGNTIIAGLVVTSLSMLGLAVWIAVAV
jgi:hypothetical protein